MKRYQIFISSTYSDLQLERQAILKSVLKMGHIPVGMEYFVAANDEQFNYIKGLLDETDYYIIIIGNRYGTQDDNGISYTEKEFDYAVEKKIPVIACIHSKPDSLPVSKSDIKPDAIQKLNEFRNKVMDHRLVSYFSWENPSELSAEVVTALFNAINNYPRPGWERVVSYENSDLLNQINDLRIENDKIKSQLDKERELNEQKNQIMKFPWNETRTFIGFSHRADYKNITIPVSLTWSQIFSIFGPILLVQSNIDLIHYALNHALFLDHEPQFCVPDIEFQLIVAEFLKYGIIDVDQNKITLTKAGKQSLNTIRVSVDDELNLIHAKVMMAFNDMPQKSHEKISDYINLLSNFNSNPEAINYIGNTLLDLGVFLDNQTEWDKGQVELVQKEIKDILNEASESKRIKMGVFVPIFNLAKINNIIDFLKDKLQEPESSNSLSN